MSLRIVKLIAFLTKDPISVFYYDSCDLTLGQPKIQDCHLVSMKTYLRRRLRRESARPVRVMSVTLGVRT